MRHATAAFPKSEVERVLRPALEGLRDDLTALRPPWELDLDSLAIVDVVIVVEKVVGFKIRPEQLVRKGGYRSVAEAIPDIVSRLSKQWDAKMKDK